MYGSRKKSLKCRKKSWKCRKKSLESLSDPHKPISEWSTAKIFDIS